MSRWDQPSRLRRQGRQAAFDHHGHGNPDEINPYKGPAENPNIQWLRDKHARDWREGWDAYAPTARAHLKAEELRNEIANSGDC